MKPLVQLFSLGTVGQIIYIYSNVTVAGLP